MENKPFPLKTNTIKVLSRRPGAKEMREMKNIIFSRATLNGKVVGGGMINCDYSNFDRGTTKVK